jgi:hypothetical protein
MKAETEAEKLRLTPSVSSLTIVSQLLTELEAVEEFFLKMKVKSSLSKVELPKTSKILEELAKLNKLNLIKSEERASLVQYLHYLRTKAPTVHISFGSTPDEIFVANLADWFRAEINPNVMIVAGLQPNIGAGFKMRTTNKYYDFSLRKYLVAGKQTLVEALGQVKK